jgi:GNAT superfamily N-acetyltransferase
MLHAMEFEPLTAADLPLVVTWLARPHVPECWDGPIVLEPGLRQFLAVLDGEAIGYVQSYQAAACHSEGWWLEVTDLGVFGIDQFLADAAKLGQGLGTEMVRAFVAQLIMTITTMAAGLLPLLWADGSGAEIMKRVAAPMLGGLATSAFLTLEVLPVLYTIWRGRQLRHSQRSGVPLETIVGAVPAWARR